MSHLDLSGADNSGFEAMPSDEYNAITLSVELIETKGGPDAKLPAGSPMVKVGFAIQDEPYIGRQAFTNIVLVGADEAKTKKALGQFVNFVAAVTGEDAEQVKVSGFDLSDISSLAQKECVIRLGPPDTKFNPDNTWNTVKGIKPAGTKGEGAAPHGLIG